MREQRLTQKQLAERLGRVARGERQRLHLTQQDVAERIRLAPEVYGRLERGVMLPSVPTLYRLCRALGMDANSLLGLEGKPLFLEPAFAEVESLDWRRTVRLLRFLAPRQLAVVRAVARGLLGRAARRVHKGLPRR